MEYPLLPSIEELAAIERAARHYYYEEDPMPDTFWRNAAASLPPHVRRRYAHLFEAAERYEPVIDFLVDSAHRARRALGRIFSAREESTGRKASTRRKIGPRVGV